MGTGERSQGARLQARDVLTPKMHPNPKNEEPER